MDRTIIDYVTQSKERIISPIWGGEKAFDFLCMGYLTQAQAMGFELKRISDQLEIVREGQLTSREQLDTLIKNKQVDHKYFQWEYDYLPQMHTWGIAKFCGGGCFGPLTVASCILGAENMLRLIVKDPDMVEDLVKYITDIQIQLAKKEEEIGQDLFWIAEPVASLLAPKRFWRFSGQYLQKIYASVKAPGFLHVCGKTTKHTRLLEQTGAQVLSIDYCTDIGQCLEEVGKDTIIMGNISPNTLRFGTKEEVAAEVTSVLNACRGHRNFVMSSGCSLMEGTPDENMQVMFELTKNDKFY